MRQSFSCAVLMSSLVLVACGSSDQSGGEAAQGGAPSNAAGAPASGAGGQLASAGSAGAATPQGGALGSSDVGGGGSGALGGDAGSSASAGSAGQGGAGGAASGGAAGSSGDLDPKQPPGKNFDLTHFTLQLPLANGDSVQQVSNLATYTSDYFYTGTDGAMTFWCPVTGAHTENTHYPRSELREVADGGDWAITGTHKLTASFKMLQNPPSKGTIIGQIHGNATGGTSEIVKLEWTRQNTIVASVEDNDDGTTQIDKTLGSYTFGSQLSYTLELKNSVLTVSVTDSKGTKTVSNPYTAASWTKDKYYFKLGDYVQLDTGTSKDGGRVAFYSFAVEHGK